jgi:hypothetical protein
MSGAGDDGDVDGLVASLVEDDEDERPFFLFFRTGGLERGAVIVKLEVAPNWVEKVSECNVWARI